MQKSKTVIVTGAARGIGRAIVARLLKEKWQVVAIDRDEGALKDLADAFAKVKLLTKPIDISHEKDVITFFGWLKRQHLRADALVNNAGIIRDNMIWNMPVDDFDAVMAVNLKGTWLMCREAARLMKEQKSGRIVNIASRAWLGNVGQSNYSASKAGIIGLTRVLALELGRHNVCVNAVAPGLIDTHLTQKLEKEVLARLIEAQPTKTMGKPEDVANLVSFLVSEKTHFITGQTIYVDGGKSIGAGT